MAAACAGMSGLARLNHELSGLAGIRSLRVLDDSLQDESAPAEFADTLRDCTSGRWQCPGSCWSCRGSPHSRPRDAGRAGMGAGAIHRPVRCPGRAVQPGTLPRAPRPVVADQYPGEFCARAYPTVPVQHPDAPALTVLGGFLRNGFLHRAIREQGGPTAAAPPRTPASPLSASTLPRPRLVQTLQDFDGAISWMLDNRHEYRALEEAILGVISSLDKPSSPAGEAKQHFHNRLFGRSHEQREQFRQRVLAVDWMICAG